MAGSTYPAWLPASERWCVVLPGRQPYYAARKTRRWWHRTSEPGAPQVGDLVLNTQGVVCRVIALDPERRENTRDYGWYTTAGWVSAAVSRPTPEELAVLHLMEQG